MAGFASMLGGLGESGENYITQIRPILERQREGYAAQLSQMAQQEGNPDYRNRLLDLSTRSVAGDNIHKIMKDHMKLSQEMQADHQAIAQAFPQQQQAPKVPGPQAGATPGTGFSGLLASQPSNSPVSPQEQTTQKLSQESMGNVMPQQPQIPPVSAPQATAALQGVTVTPQSTVQPGQRTREIVQRYIPQIQNATPVMRAQLQDAMNKEIAAIAPLEKQALAQSEYSALQQEPGYSEGLSNPTHVSAAFQAHGFTPPQVPMGYFTPRLLSTGSLGEQAPPGTVEYGTNHPPTPGTRYRVEMVPGTGEQMWIPETPQTVTTQTESGGLQLNNRNSGATIAPLAGAVVPSTNQIRSLGVDQTGHELLGSMNQLNGGSVTRSPGQVPSTLPTTHQTIQNIQGIDPVTGQPSTLRVPTTSTTTKGNLEVPPSNGFPGMSVPQDWNTQGKPTSPTSIPKFSPDQLTGGGQKDLSAIDQVLSQVRDLKSKMESRGWQKDDTHGYYPDYVKYMHGGYSSPNQDLYTGLSFEAIRSAAAALKNTGSRAYQFIQRALDHTPNLSLAISSMKASDTPKTMYGKLKEMESILNSSRDQIIADEKKSGIVSPIPGAKTSDNDPLGIR